MAAQTGFLRWAGMGSLKPSAQPTLVRTQHLLRTENPCGARSPACGQRSMPLSARSVLVSRRVPLRTRHQLASMIHPDVDVGWPGRAGRLWVLFAGSGDNGGPAGGPGGRGFHGPWVVLL